MRQNQRLRDMTSAQLWHRCVEWWSEALTAEVCAESCRYSALAFKYLEEIHRRERKGESCPACVCAECMPDPFDNWPKG